MNTRQDHDRKTSGMPMTGAIVAVDGGRTAILERPEHVDMIKR
jgi:hypothetical protein